MARTEAENAFPVAIDVSEPRHVFLVGASRGIGREVALLLRTKKIPVTALLRSTATRHELERLGVTIKLGDALRYDAVEEAMATSDAIDAVVSTLGGVSADGVRSDFAGNRNLIDAYFALKTQESEVGTERREQFIMVSSIGSGASAVAIPPQVRERLATALDEKTRAETHLIQSGLTYTVIRPGGLRSEPATGRGVLTEDHLISGTIHRPDVARLVYDCLMSDRAKNTILAAVDRDLVRDGSSFEVFALD